ncbi:MULTISPECIES: Scr1 family TA system antitoxin-like transcriptional regulator [unclassified Pseudonocardia]|uniref:Scr1 family TA system antitoxin-like transcriptional regulator n=1 Tax=unclassified Pseudonocardia TaxID=2619320 RepID=UPI00094AFD2C|nr:MULTISPECIES: Scr1 family TA system antitoxin-like transcriptional regulator [unclassified Pseudonocardia]OLL89408.1 hypothetical protein Ae331Ps2_6307 [Pseudonocardia sp. Ae331_Ps2]OLL89415.1 putative DNA-binding protein [Pseudonocardia sp. Ae331_Ps2]
MADSRPDARRHLGEELRTRRRQAGLTGHALAAIIGLDQSRISRIESGRLRISEPELQRWLHETSTPPGTCAKITDIARRAGGSPTLWRNVPISGWNIQPRDIGSLEGAAAQVAAWQSSVIPAALQTTTYMHWVATGGSVTSRQRLAASILAKIARQKILYETPRRLNVILSEEALEFRGENKEIMIDQLYWISSLARRGRFTLGVLPANIKPHIDRVPSFTIYTSPHEGVDNLVARTLDDEIFIPEASTDNVQRHIDQFRVYQRHSWRGDQAIEFVEGLAREMRAGKDSSIDTSQNSDGV